MGVQSPRVLQPGWQNQTTGMSSNAESRLYSPDRDRQRAGEPAQPVISIVEPGRGLGRDQKSEANRHPAAGWRTRQIGSQEGTAHLRAGNSRFCGPRRIPRKGTSQNAYLPGENTFSTARLEGAAEAQPETTEQHEQQVPCIKAKITAQNPTGWRARQSGFLGRSQLAG